MRKVRLSVVVAALCVVVSQAATAEASTPAAQQAGPSLSAGYLVPMQFGHILSTRFVVPTVTCSAPSSSVAFAVGLANRATGRFERLEVDVDCRDGQTLYRAAYKTSGGQRRSKGDGSIEPGDVMWLQIGAARGLVLAGLDDITQGWQWTIDAAPVVAVPDIGSVAASERRSPSSVRPLADFTSIRFQHVGVDSNPISGPVDRVTVRSGGILKAVASRLQPRPGVFRVAWRHS